MSKKLSPKEAADKVNEVYPHITLDQSTYINTTTKARFVDSVYGEWWSKLYSVMNGRQHPERGKANARTTCMSRYGVDNPSKHPDIKDVLRKRMLGNSDQQKKMQMAVLKKYGVTSVMKVSSVKEKSKATCLMKYGFEHYTKTSEYKDQVINSNKKKYGCDWYLQSEDLREKAKAFYLEKYGVPHNMMVPELKEKMFQSKISNGNSSSSIEERTLMDWVKTHCPDAVSTYYGDVGQLDIFIPSLRLAIEYNGLYWHSQEVLANRNVPSPRLYHLDKTEKCLKNGINLIHIWSHLWIERRPQVQDYLLSKFGNITRKYGARKLRFTEIDKNIARGFCKEFHIQGSPNNVSLALGAYDGEDLISVATFGLHHRNSKQLCLNRFVTFPGVLVSGGLGKFSRMASNLVQEPLLSWADRSWSGGNAYLKAGWTLEEVLPPDYFYYDDRTKTVIPKQNRKKSVVGTPNHLTESEHARLDGLLKIWDCGKLRFAFHPISIA